MARPDYPFQMKSDMHSEYSFARHTRLHFVFVLTVLVASCFLAFSAHAGGNEPHDYSGFGLLQCLPFAGVLLSIAVLQSSLPHFWETHFSRIMIFWIALFCSLYGIRFGTTALASSVWHTMVSEYIPFTILVGTLYIVTSGIYIRGNGKGTPLTNTAALGAGAVAASIMGTAGASMLLVRPLIRANDHRPHNSHVMIFLILIVANAGGSLTPLGDPPLFLGFLKGVDFFWPFANLLMPVIMLVGSLLTLFFIIDSYYAKKDSTDGRSDPTPASEVHLSGWRNVFLLLLVPAVILITSTIEKWSGAVGNSWTTYDIIRDLALIFIAGASMRFTPPEIHKENDYSRKPLVEVAIIFAAIFLTLIPVLEMLNTPSGFSMFLRTFLNGADNENANAQAYFWLTGLLSSFLDNAPTYLLFFNLAGGDAATLMDKQAQVLSAISTGAVFFGAFTYIGNAPNLLVKVVAEQHGVRMPTFIGYMKWSICVLLPLVWLISQIFY